MVRVLEAIPVDKEELTMIHYALYMRGGNQLAANANCYHRYANKVQYSVMGRGRKLKLIG